MRNNTYEAIIIPREVKPMLGENNYVAKVNIYKIGESEKGPIQHDLGESWGKTEIDACEKMNKKVEDWLKVNE